MSAPEIEQIKRALLDAAAHRSRAHRRSRRRVLAAAAALAGILVIGGASVVADVGPLARDHGAGGGPLARTFTAIPATPAEIEAASANDAAVNASGPGMIRCDENYRCVGITPSPQAMASDKLVYVRVVHGGLTPARLAIGAPIFQSGELFCVGTTTLTCVPAREQAPVVPRGTTAIAGYIHQDIKIEGTRVVWGGTLEPPPTVAAIPG